MSNFLFIQLFSIHSTNNELLGTKYFTKCQRYEMSKANRVLVFLEQPLCAQLSYSLLLLFCFIFVGAGV
jgi:hypothetical protein